MSADKKLNRIMDQAHKKDRKIKAFLLPDDEGFDPYIVFQGDKKALLMMSDIFKAVANYEHREDFHIHPQGSGRSRFTKGSDCGFYIELIPDKRDRDKAV